MANATADRMDQAVAEVAAWVQLDPSARELGPQEVRLYSRHGARIGWRISLPFEGGPRRIDILVCGGFPWTPVRIALVDRPDSLEWPHVERDGVLCLMTSQATIDPRRPAGVAQYLLEEAHGLVSRLIAGSHASDFRDEFLSYWSWGCDERKVPVISLCRPEGPSREIRSWTGRDFILLAEDDQSISKWLAHRHGESSRKPPSTAPALFAALPDAPVPSEFPDSGTALLSLLQTDDPEAAEMLKRLVRESDNGLVVALCAATSRGPALAAVSVPRPKPMAVPGRKGRDPLQRGFRPGRVPVDVFMTRCLGGSKVIKMEVQRADGAWVHGRGEDARFARLRDAKVVVVGCGSLGAPVAQMLAQAGVGRLVLVDPDRLGWSNVGRHTLGAADVGSPKAQRLAHKIRRDFPHIVDVEAHVAHVEEILLERDSILSDADLIVSASGAWSANAALDDWRTACDPSPPIVYAWTEEHACAGHAVALHPGGCLRCGFDPTGMPMLRLTAWPAGDQFRHEPACGSVYQPYGPIELAHIATLAAETAMDCLMQAISTPTHRIWAGAGRRLAQLGGQWSPEWVAIAPDRLDGSFVSERNWPPQATCSGSAGTMAA